MGWKREAVIKLTGRKVRAQPTGQRTKQEYRARGSLIQTIKMGWAVGGWGGGIRKNKN